MMMRHHTQVQLQYGSLPPRANGVSGRALPLGEGEYDAYIEAVLREERPDVFVIVPTPTNRVTSRRGRAYKANNVHAAIKRRLKLYNAEKLLDVSVRYGRCYLARKEGSRAT